MPNGPGTFDGDLQQWRESAGLNAERLAFQRWLIVRGRSEHPIAGPPSGDFATSEMLDLYISASHQEASCSRP